MNHLRATAILVAVLIVAPLVALVTNPQVASAQQGAITYDRATRLAVELPPELRDRIGDEIPGETFDAFVVLFSPDETVMIPADAPEGGEEAPVPGADGMRSQRLERFMSRMQQTSPERSDQERLVVVHTDLNSGAVVENRTFMGRTFLVRGDRAQVQWQLTGEQSLFADYLVLQALATVDGAEVEAWFTPQIPVPGGPADFGGLPGMILSLSIDGGRILYSATGISMVPVDEGAIRPPSQGQEITRDDYESLVAERLQELSEMREQRGRRRGGS